VIKLIPDCIREITRAEISLFVRFRVDSWIVCVRVDRKHEHKNEFIIYEAMHF